MKSKEEIEQLAEQYAESFRFKISSSSWHEEKCDDFTQGYTKCQEDMADEIVDFHDWIRLSKPSELKYVGNVNGKCYDYKREYYTTKELYNIYKSLNKQD